MKTKRQFLILLIIIVLSKPGLTQPWYFNELYNPNNTWASGLSIIGTSNGYFGCAISGDSVSDYYYNTCTFLLNPEGEIVFWKNFGKNGYDFYPGYYGSLVQTQYSCYALFGSQHNFQTGFSNGIFYKFNSDGDTLFSKTFFSDSFNTLIGRTCTSTLDGGYVLFGEVSVGLNFSDVILIKTDSGGNEIWRKLYGTSVDDWAVSIVQTNDFGYALGTWAYIPGQIETADPLIIKTDSLGNFEWSLNLGGSYGDDKVMVSTTNDSCIIALSAYADSMYTPEYAYTRINLIKIDQDGNTIWNRKYGASKAVNFITNIISLENGDFMACGYCRYSAYLDPVGWLFKFDYTGDSLWYHEYFYYPENPSYSLNYLYDVSNTMDNGFIAAGCSSTLFPPNQTVKMWVLKVDSVGCEIENCLVGIEEPGGGEAGKPGDLEIWPNPARDWIMLSFPENSSNDVTELVIYNIFGQDVLKMVVIPRNRSVSLKVSNLSPGIYLITCKDSKKRMLNGKFVVSR